MGRQNCMFCHAWQQAGCKMVQLHVVLSVTAVLAVHKLLSWLPYCATPSVAQTSCGVSLISLLYTSTQRAEHIVTWRELKIIATQTLPAFCDGIETESTLLLRQRKKRGRQRWKRIFLHTSDLCLSLVLNPRHTYSGRGQLNQ